jgi:hypothetical protein
MCRSSGSHDTSYCAKAVLRLPTEQVEHPLPLLGARIDRLDVLEG